jgi:hypothetical protein
MAWWKFPMKFLRKTAREHFFGTKNSEDRDPEKIFMVSWFLN